jgi:hypothetical protein
MTDLKKSLIRYAPDEDLKIIKGRMDRITFPELHDEMPTRSVRSIQSRYMDLKKSGDAERIKAFLSKRR